MYSHIPSHGNGVGRRWDNGPCPRIKDFALTADGAARRVRRIIDFRGGIRALWMWRTPLRRYARR